MIKILHIIPKINKGGTEMVILNLYKNMDHKKFKFDFLVEGKGDFEYAFLGESTIHKLAFSDKVQYKKDLINFLKLNNDYKIIHTHTSPHMGIALEAANEAGVAGRIAHSHNSRNDLPAIYKLLKIIQNRKIEKNANCLLACSVDASKWLYPLRNREALYIKNGVDHEIFKFNAKKRKKIRKDLNLKDEDFAMVMVARLSNEKNHQFAINILDKITKNDDRIKLYLIGDGPLKERIEEQIIKLGLTKKIIVIGHKNNISDYYSAFDLSILTSYAEGLGLVLIESQINGLNCISSNGIPVEANIGKLTRLNLDSSLWIKYILKAKKEKDTKTRISKKLDKSIYDINIESKKLSKIYEDLYLNNTSNEVHL